MKPKHNSYSAPFLGTEVTVQMDRPMGSTHPKHGFLYPVNYGFVPNTKAPDGEEIDAYVLGVFEPVDEFRGICIAIIKREDDDDDKLVIVPKDIFLTKEEIRTLTNFQEQFFKSTITSLSNPLPYPAETPIGFFERYLASLKPKVKKQNELHLAFQKHRKDTSDFLSWQIQQVSEILKIDFRTLVDQSDFHFNNKDKGAIESLIGVIRGVYQLNEEGFDGIELIKCSKKAKAMPDIKATYKKEDWYIEVKTVLSTTRLSRSLQPSDIKQALIETMEPKVRQFINTPQHSRKLVLLVINAERVNIFQSNQALYELVKETKPFIDSEIYLGCLFRDGFYVKANNDFATSINLLQ